MKEFDTIAAIATSIGEGGIAIIRISGSKALDIIDSIFIGKNNRKLKDIKSYTMRYGHIVSMDSGETIDEVIISFMKGPKSFTAEDTVEINCHGGIIATNRVLEEVIKAGARIADPGEFTKRAFLNGRIDLSQAEAVIDIIRAKTELSMKSALSQSQGRISREISKIRQQLLSIIAHIEATVDYPEEDLEEMTSMQAVDDLQLVIKDIQHLINTSNEGKILRDGLDTVIVGKPNVGKSSLLNAILMEKRAIVTDIPGTTRDIIEEFINLDGVPVKVVDTAGIRETQDIVEKIGVERSKEKLNEADLVILVLDVSRSLDEEDREIINFLRDKKYIVLLNKSDLESQFKAHELEELDPEYIIDISAKTGQGIEQLKNLIKKLFFSGEVNSKDILITNSRHKEALIRANDSCLSALFTLEQQFTIDLASIDIRSAWYCLGEITGESLGEDLIDKIFSDFCIGK